MGKNINNQVFIDLLNEGNANAFQLLFKLYRSKLLYISKNYISNKEDAEEIIQDVFLKVWSNKNIQSNVNGYLYAVTRNACLDYLRKKKLTLNIENNTQQIEACINYAAFADDLASSIVEKELEEAILVGIEFLPDKCKDVFVMSRIEGLKHKEISKELNISTKTVENHITKALKHMRVYLREFLPFL
tara:strand:+ start:238 stop:801 length:564 start_codon:yes stop_codon:yes gene_type:complete